jgi:hypothetical protein
MKNRLPLKSKLANKCATPQEQNRQRLAYRLAKLQARSSEDFLQSALHYS